MTFPVVYDILLRAEVEARNPSEGVQTILDTIAQHGVDTAAAWAVEIIRDDNTHPPKDYHSRHSNGFAIFTSAQKLELVSQIAHALEAAGKGNRTPGNTLLADLTRQLAYLDNSKLDGIQL